MQIQAILQEAFGVRKGAKLTRFVTQAYSEKHRYYHNLEHINNLLSKTNDLDLSVAIIFHDIFYRPGYKLNEARSATIFSQLAGKCKKVNVPAIKTAIMESMWADNPKSSLGKKLFLLDCAILLQQASFRDRLNYERAIFKEYQNLGFEQYKEGRRKFLERWTKRFTSYTKEQLAVLDAFEPTRAIYPGSFSPFHSGHLSIIRKGEQIFDQIVVAMGINPEKKNQITIQDRTAILYNTLTYHQVVGFDTLLADMLKDFPNTKLIRSIRNGTDLDQELHWLRWMEDLAPTHPVIWVSCDERYQHISSSAIRNIKAFDPKVAEKYVPTTGEIYQLKT